MLRKKLVIQNKLGLHARASAKLVDHASRYASKIFIAKDNQTVNSKSIMGMMMLAANKGSVIELIVDGEDEIAAMADLENLILNKFGEKE